MDRKWARPWFAATAVCVVIGIVLQLFISADATQAFGGSPLNRALNIFAYFTIQSNIIAGVTCLWLAIRPNLASAAFRVFRLMGIIAITVTGIVYHVALSGLLELDTRAQVANQLQHTIVPIMAVVGWLAFGPRGLTSKRIAWLTVIDPLAYMLFTMIRGPLASNFYPYPFADIHKLGYLRVVVNGIWIALLFAGLAGAATLLDKRLPGGEPAAALTR